MRRCCQRRSEEHFCFFSDVCDSCRACSLCFSGWDLRWQHRSLAEGKLRRLPDRGEASSLTMSCTSQVVCSGAQCVSKERKDWIVVRLSSPCTCATNIFREHVVMVFEVATHGMGGHSAFALEKRTECVSLDVSIGLVRFVFMLAPCEDNSSLSVFLVVCVCPVAIPATAWCWCCPYYIVSTGVPGLSAMVSKLRRGVRGSQGKSVQKESWRVRSRCMG